ncbi:MAG: transporter [Ignavibacteria bacterium]|nr:transporter [Ignavibacteria bacterium]
MKIVFIIISAFIFSNSELYSQKLPALVTDRPDITESALTVQKNRLQIETGFLFLKRENLNYYPEITVGVFNKMYTVVNKDISVPSILFRYGISSYAELRLGLLLKYSEVSYDKFYDGSNSTDLAPVNIGGKLELGEQDGVIPTAAVILQGEIPALSTESNTEESKDWFDPSVIFCFNNSVTDNFSLGYNIGFDLSDGFTEGNGVFYSLAAGYSFSDRFSGFVEYFGSTNFYHLIPNNGMDIGFAYLINNNIQLDVSAGADLEDISKEYFLSTGFSIRLPD